MKIYKLFEDYLMEEHAKDYHGTDDAMPNAFEAWLAELDGNDLIEYANEAMMKLKTNKKT